MQKFYSDDKNVQILLALLKAHGIKKIVASPGVANITFVASAQQDSYFEIYSSVDERSAAYIACGLAEESKEPVVISCTGATASRNYMPALTEAYYRKLPILAVTSCRDIAWVGQNSPQQIDRSVQPKDIVRYSLHLPTLHNKQEEDRYTTLINKAILELSKDGGGPVHINLTNGYTGKYTTKELPKVRVIQRISKFDSFPTLPKGKIGIFVGAHSVWTEELLNAVEKFCRLNNAVVLCDHLSNYHGDYEVFHNLITCQKQYRPACSNLDLMVYIGNIHGTDYENLSPKEVWRVNIDGEIRDSFGGMTHVFQMNEYEFFEHYTNRNGCSVNTFIEEWKQIREELESRIPELPFSNVWVGRQILKHIPDNSIIHYGIQNSLRTWNFTQGPKYLLGYSNTGGFGIDGCVSSLVGASLAYPNKVYYGVVGDLAFFYDMNALGNRHIGNNIRLIVVNNGRGQQFRNPYSAGGRFGEFADTYIAAAGHNGDQSQSLLMHFAQDLGFRYFSASNKEELLQIIPQFTKKEIEESIVLEVFTDTNDESESLRIICNLKIDVTMEIVKHAKRIGRKILGDDLTNKISNLRL